MIATIGSLVQETSTRLRWLIATALYTVACISTSLLLGAFLGLLGHLGTHIVCSTLGCAPFPPATKLAPVAIGLLAVAYASSDLGLVRLPRPRLMKAVPVTWWRWWRPYGASLAYGAALGLGLTTHITFSAFYVLCAWCVVQGNVLYGALLMGTYGAWRALTLIPASWGVYCLPIHGECGSTVSNRRAVSNRRIDSILSYVEYARGTVAVVLVAFGAQVLLSALL